MQATATILENPLREGIRLERTAEPCAVIIFGASGDLAKRKLIPALYRLVQERLLPAEFAIVGLSRTEMTEDEFRARMKSAVESFQRRKRLMKKFGTRSRGGCSTWRRKSVTPKATVS